MFLSAIVLLYVGKGKQKVYFWEIENVNISYWDENMRIFLTILGVFLQFVQKMSTVD